MKRIVLSGCIAVSACLLAFAVQAQAPAPSPQVVPYEAPDEELWVGMRNALATLPIALSAHQQLQNILSNAEKQAQERAAKKREADSERRAAAMKKALEEAGTEKKAKDVATKP